MNSTVSPVLALTSLPVFPQTGPPVIGGGSSGGGTLPQFNTITIRASPPNSLGITLILVEGPPNAAGAYFSGGVLGDSGPVASGITAYEASWSSVTVSGQTLTFNGLEVSGSEMSGPGGVADITSGSLTITLTPQVVSTSGTVTGSMNLVSTLGTISGSFTGTYTAQ